MNFACVRLTFVKKIFLLKYLDAKRMMLIDDIFHEIHNGPFSVLKNHRE